MKDFKGFDDWIEIFKGGRQTDSQGRDHDGDTIIESAVSSFNPSVHEPPLVIGHPIDNAPAFGWVEGLKTAIVGGTKVLLAKFKQVTPELINLVKQGLYKKRSASFYPDGSLRHVGFLGAAPPAVKGLANIFSEGGGEMLFEFSGKKDAGEILEDKVRELLNQARCFSENGSGAKSNLTYREAFEIVMSENPELAQEYAESMGLTI